MANSRKGQIDMTIGHIMKNIILFAIPIIIGNVLQQLYTTVDALVIGQYCGDTSLAAVGTSSQPVEVLLCVFLGIGTGVSILISQYAGAKESDKVVSICGTSITFIYIIGIPVGILGWFAAPYILEFMKVPQDVWDAALIYTRLVFLGTLGNLGYNMNAGILRGLGDSKASLWFLVVSFLSSIIVRFHGFNIIPDISPTSSADLKSCSISVKNVDLTSLPPLSSSSKLVNALHHFNPSGDCTTPIFIFSDDIYGSTAIINCPPFLICFLMTVRVCASISCVHSP